jgi:hypothetical protein
MEGMSVKTTTDLEDFTDMGFSYNCFTEDYIDIAAGFKTYQLISLV